jgi:RNA ligase (TIGR02306 family)
MRKLSKLKTISAILPIENADAIELVKFDDCSWQCVSKKGEFQIGDQCIYFEIDSLLPNSNPVFDFLAHGNSIKKVYFEGQEYTGYRLKTIKLRGELSQGLALPLSCFPELDLSNEDIDTQLNIQKYEPILQISDGSDLGQFHELVPKTDEERIQNLTKKYENWKDIDMVATEKLDGTSCTIIYELDIKRLFSRNLEKKIDIGHKYDIATQNILFPNNYAVQGEIIGEGIQGNSYKQGGFHFYAFNVYDIFESKYLQDLEAKEFCKQHNIKMVPEVWKGKLSEFESVNDLLLFAEGKSVLCQTANREGLVFRSTTFDKNNRISFKVISNKFLLKSKD